MNQNRFLVADVIVVVWVRESGYVYAHVVAPLFFWRRDSQTGQSKMAEYDLTRTIIPYLDRHLVFPLLSHLHESGLFSPEQVAAAQYELAKGTNMVDYIVSLYEQLNPDSEVPQGMKQF
jgi:hypothetical protein